jgi:hypothetical protein
VASKKNVGRISEAEQVGSRKCHFAMTQVFLGQADSTGDSKSHESPEFELFWCSGGGYSSKFPCQFFHDLFYCVFGCFSAMGVQKHHEKFLQKNRQKSKTDVFLICFLSRFWAFLSEGSPKTQ